MQISKSGKIALGIATAIVTLIPLLFVAIWLIFVFGMNYFPTSFFDPFYGGGFDSIRQLFDLFFGLICCLNLLIYGLVAFYIVHIVKNTEGSQVIRILFALSLFFLPYIGMPVYYLIYIFPTRPPEWALEKPSTNP